MEQQLTIFDVLPTPIKAAFVVEDPVIVVANVNEQDVEDYYYLKDHEGLKGQVVKLLSHQQYEVQFPNRERTGIFGHEELRRI